MAAPLPVIEVRVSIPMPPDTGTSITRRVMAGTGWMMGWRVISRSIGFVSMLILARLLTPADFGIIAVGTAVSASIESLSQLGVRDALVRLHDDRRNYYDTAFSFQVARGLLTGLLLVAFSLFSDSLLGDPRLHTILLPIAAFTVVAACENIGVVSFTRKMDFRIQFLMQVAPRLVGFIVTTGLAFTLRDYRALIWGMGVSKLVGVGVSYMAAPYRPRFGLTGWRYLLGFSFWTWGAGLGLMVWTRADAFLLAPVLGTAQLGIFLLAGEVALMPVSELLEPACATLFPAFAQVQRSGAAPVSLGLTVAGILALGTIPFAIGVSACSGYLVAGLLGPQWQPARPLIAILAWICIFSPFSYVCSSMLSAQGQVRRVFAANAAAALLKVVVVLLVRQTHDLTLISAAAVGATAVEASIFIFQLHVGNSRESRQVVMTMLRATISSAATCSVLRLCPGAWDDVQLDRIEALAIGATIGLLALAVFAVCQLLLWRIVGCPVGIEARLFELLRDGLRLDDPRRH
jgi:lipopolysaccharide exporter